MHCLYGHRDVGRGRARCQLCRSCQGSGADNLPRAGESRERILVHGMLFGQSGGGVANHPLQTSLRLAINIMAQSSRPIKASSSLNILQLFLIHPEIVAQFMNDRPADLFADFGLAGADRFNIFLIEHDVIGSRRQVKYALPGRGYAVEETQKQPLALSRSPCWLVRRQILHQNSNVTNAAAKFLWERVERLLDYLGEMFALHPSPTAISKSALTPSSRRCCRHHHRHRHLFCRNRRLLLPLRPLPRLALVEGEHWQRPADQRGLGRGILDIFCSCSMVRLILRDNLGSSHESGTRNRLRRSAVPCLFITRNYSSVLFVRTHVSGSQIAVVPAQRFSQQVRRMFAIRQPLGPIKIIEEQTLVVRIGALLDDDVGALTRRES